MSKPKGKDTTFTYRGPYQQTYPGHHYPGQDSVLVVDPGEIVDFGDGLPPADGQWYDSAGNQVLPPAPVEEPEAAPADTGPGTGTDANEES
jgi:hypothetical protein